MKTQFVFNREEIKLQILWTDITMYLQTILLNI
jgi:hypothetical protein